MKKFLLIAVALFCVVSVSAQSKFDSALQTISEQTWSAGLRLGSGLQVQAEYAFDNGNYIEGRFGMSWLSSSVTADFTALYQWQLCNWNWTPNAGKWFLDAGAGINIGGREHFCYLGVAGSVKFGIKFKKAPVKLAIDWTPVFGPAIAYYPAVKDTDSDSELKARTYTSFHSHGLANFGISAVYCF